MVEATGKGDERPVRKRAAQAGQVILKPTGSRDQAFGSQGEKRGVTCAAGDIRYSRAFRI